MVAKAFTPNMNTGRRSLHAGAVCAVSLAVSNSSVVLLHLVLFLTLRSNDSMLKAEGSWDPMICQEESRRFMALHTAVTYAEHQRM